MLPSHEQILEAVCTKLTSQYQEKRAPSVDWVRFLIQERMTCESCSLCMSLRYNNTHIFLTAYNFKKKQFCMSCICLVINIQCAHWASILSVTDKFHSFGNTFSVAVTQARWEYILKKRKMVNYWSAVSLGCLSGNAIAEQFKENDW